MPAAFGPHRPDSPGGRAPRRRHLVRGAPGSHLRVRPSTELRLRSVRRPSSLVPPGFGPWVPGASRASKGNKAHGRTGAQGRSATARGALRPCRRSKALESARSRITSVTRRSGTGKRARAVETRYGCRQSALDPSGSGRVLRRVPSAAGNEPVRLGQVGLPHRRPARTGGAVSRNAANLVRHRVAIHPRPVRGPNRRGGVKPRGRYPPVAGQRPALDVSRPPSGGRHRPGRIVPSGTHAERRRCEAIVGSRVRERSEARHLESESQERQVRIPAGVLRQPGDRGAKRLRARIGPVFGRGGCATARPAREAPKTTQSSVRRPAPSFTKAHTGSRVVERP